MKAFGKASATFCVDPLAVAPGTNRIDFDQTFLPAIRPIPCPPRSPTDIVRRLRLPPRPLQVRGGPPTPFPPPARSHRHPSPEMPACNATLLLPP
ncbi:hypothetical protein GCM10022229_25910 [Luteimonas lutimaris]|uniref:Uncharacterized protein n=1 Tax=Luteimonas lutimaris TaxID=698645 RepID=A0ABP7MVJ3_9GAMM